ncbi:MAG: LPS export ABC transporter permease LptF [Alphaproteobacteria bacterium]|nr:LPS export ABC transporter permease LptF [Alphaproteobacteria bacterium]MBF0249127.1 LPS export ABC transporter permease LptF [Alphaproteobacteria bacterium]
MLKLTRYMLWQLFVGLTLVTSVLASVVWLSQSLRFVDMIVNSGLTAGMFVYLTALMMPNFLTVILPIAVFAVCMFTYHRMIMDRELVVMRVAGLGQMDLARPAIILALMVVVAGYALSMYVVPHSWSQFREMKWNAQFNYSQLLLREGTFNEAANDITVYVRQRTEDGQLLGILAHDERKPENTFTWMAERGALVETDQGARVVLYNGTRQDYDTRANKLSILYFDRTVLDIDAPEAATSDRMSEPRERTMDELVNLDTRGLDEYSLGKYHAELHRRFALPWSALGFAMIALSVLMSGNFTRRGEGKRVFAAILLAAGYQAAMLAILNVASRDTTHIPSIYLVTALPIVLGLIVLVSRLGIGKTQPSPPTTAGGRAS